MKKSELKNIIKECVKEVIFEEGVLSGIISEVVAGMSSTPLMHETKRTKTPTKNNQISETKKQILSAIGGDAYADAKKKFSNPELFEGTKPVADGDGKGPLSGIAPNDPGIDISNLPGMSNWGAIANRTGRK